MTKKKLHKNTFDPDKNFSLPNETKSQNNHLNSGVKFSPRKKVMFTGGVIFLIFIFFSALELVLRVAGFGKSYELFVSGTGEYANFYYINPVVTKRYFPTLKQVPTGTNDMFLKKKPANGFRIFVLGGSSAAGYPYPNNMMFSRLLNLALNKAYPNKWVEVVNLSTSAINTWTLLDFVREMVRFEPDLVLIYAGHNEYYGALGIGSSQSVSHSRFIINLYLKAHRFKVFLLLKDGIHALQNLWSSDDGTAPSSTLMQQVVRKKSIPFGSTDFIAGVKQYRSNLVEIINILRSNGIPVILSDLVSNLKDQKPFVSIPGKKSADSLYAMAAKAVQRKKYHDADSLFRLAKDYDALRFRAPEELNRVVDELAEKNNLIRIHMNDVFKNASPDGLIGNELILEHVHPNPNGYRLMARAFWKGIMESGILPDPVVDGDSVIANLDYYTRFDSVLGELKIKILKNGWPFNKGAASSRRMIDYPAQDPVWKLVADTYTHKIETVEKAHVLLASSYEKEGKWEKAIKEYDALIALTPLNTAPYEKKARILVNLQKFDRALAALLDWEVLQDNFYSKKWIGQIYLMKHKTMRALPYLEAALDLNNQDPQLLYNYGGALAMTGKYKKALSVVQRVEQINPRFPGLTEFKNQLVRKMAIYNSSEKTE